MTEPGVESAGHKLSRLRSDREGSAQLELRNEPESERDSAHAETNEPCPRARTVTQSKTPNDDEGDNVRPVQC
jgi:hypothetical protein